MYDAGLLLPSNAFHRLLLDPNTLRLNNLQKASQSCESDTNYVNDRHTPENSTDSLSIDLNGC
eukprot:scaffold125740_cov50-Attheya_sp.AAC.5